MFVAGIHCVVKNPSIFITGSFYSVCKYILMLTFSEPSTIRVSSTAPYFLCVLRHIVCIITEIVMTASAFIVVIILVFKRLFAMLCTIFVYFFSKHFFVKQRFMFCELMLHLSVVCSCFDMSCIYEHSCWINELETIAVFKDTLEYLLEEICIFKSSCIVLSKCGEVWYRIDKL